VESLLRNLPKKRQKHSSKNTGLDVGTDENTTHWEKDRDGARGNCTRGGEKEEARQGIDERTGRED